MIDNTDKIKTAILNASKKEFEEKGYKGASMRTIAAGAGISAAGIYNYFESKDAIFLEIVAPAVKFIRDLDHVPQTPREVRSVMKKFVLAQEEAPEAFRLAFCMSYGSKLFQEFAELTQNPDPMVEFRSRVFFMLLFQISYSPMAPEHKETIIQNYISTLS